MGRDETRRGWSEHSWVEDEGTDDDSALGLYGRTVGWQLTRRDEMRRDETRRGRVVPQHATRGSRGSLACVAGTASGRFRRTARLRAVGSNSHGRWP
eukprot:scaffold23227_cov89-Phaeocystis_antarctica.AAC.1